jgi:membrane protease YdiL (CAAX protease family)
MMEFGSGKRVFMRTGFALLVMMTLTVVLQLIGFRIFVWAQDNEWLRYAFSVLPQYFIAMPIAALIMRKTPSLPAEKKKLKAGQFTLIVLICFAIMYAGNLIGVFINLIIQMLAQSNMTNLIQQLITSSSVWANLVFVALLAPVIEELFFRRLLIPKLLPFGEKPAIIVSGLAFGLMHGNITQFFYAFGLGLAFGYIFVKTGKVTYTIILHMIINFFGSVISVLALNANFILTGLYGLIVICLAIAGIVLFFVFKKRIVMSAGLLSIDKGKNEVFLNVGMILFYIVSAAVFVMNTYAMFTQT